MFQTIFVFSLFLLVAVEGATGNMFQFLILIIKFKFVENVICYYEPWSIDTFDPENIDVSICTHVNYAFLGIDENGTLLFNDTNADSIFLNFYNQ